MNINNITEKILSSKKYRNLRINRQFISNIITEQKDLCPNEKACLKAIKKKIHNIVASYLGDIDYETECRNLKLLKNMTVDQKKHYAEGLLVKHASTKERIPILDKFYKEIFNITGIPDTVADLACGLNPLTLFWMNLKKNCSYYAYDIREDRIDFLNLFFRETGYKELAVCQDIATEIPSHYSDLTFIFKEVHRLEQRKKGISRDILNQLNSDYIAVSLPKTNIHRRHDLSESYRNLFFNIIKKDFKYITELDLYYEMVFIIKKK